MSCTIVLGDLRKWMRVSVLTLGVELPPPKQAWRFHLMMSGGWMSSVSKGSKSF